MSRFSLNRLMFGSSFATGLWGWDNGCIWMGTAYRMKIEDGFQWCSGGLFEQGTQCRVNPLPQYPASRQPSPVVEHLPTSLIATVRNLEAAAGTYDVREDTYSAATRPSGWSTRNGGLVAWYDVGCVVSLWEPRELYSSAGYLAPASAL
ncbi:hypothetical protein EDC04DRAFT_3096971, partial [Pisolithus marmoratus]